MKPLKVKGRTLRERGTISAWLQNDFAIGDWDFIRVGDDKSAEGELYHRELLIKGGILGSNEMPVNNPGQLITAIANRTKVTVNYGRPGDSVNIFFSRKMIADAKIIRRDDEDTDDLENQMEYFDEEDDDQCIGDMMSCTEEEHGYDDVPED